MVTSTYNRCGPNSNTFILNMYGANKIQWGISIHNVIYEHVEMPLHGSLPFIAFNGLRNKLLCQHIREFNVTFVQAHVMCHTSPKKQKKENIVNLLHHHQYLVGTACYSVCLFINYALLLRGHCDCFFFFHLLPFRAEILHSSLWIQR